MVKIMIFFYIDNNNLYNVKVMTQIVKYVLQEYKLYVDSSLKERIIGITYCLENPNGSLR